MLVRYPNLLSWLLLMWRSSSFALRPCGLWLAEVLILSLRESLRDSPGTCWRKLMSAAYIHGLIFLVTKQSSWWMYIDCFAFTFMITITDQYSVCILHHCRSRTSPSVNLYWTLFQMRHFSVSNSFTVSKKKNSIAIVWPFSFLILYQDNPHYHHYYNLSHAFLLVKATLVDFFIRYACAI